MKNKILKSAGILKPAEPTELRPPTPGPHSAGLGSQVPDKAYVVAHARAEDWAEWRSYLEARSTSTRINMHLRCNNPGCGKTDIWPANAENGPCFWCNTRGTKEGGHLIALTPAEITAWEAQQKTRRDQYAAGAAERKRRVDEFNRRRREDRYNP